MVSSGGKTLQPYEFIGLMKMMIRTPGSQVGVDAGAVAVLVVAANLVAVAVAGSKQGSKRASKPASKRASKQASEQEARLLACLLACSLACSPVLACCVSKKWFCRMSSFIATPIFYFTAASTKFCQLPAPILKSFSDPVRAAK